MLISRAVRSPNSCVTRIVITICNQPGLSHYSHEQWRVAKCLVHSIILVALNMGFLQLPGHNSPQQPVFFECKAFISEFQAILPYQHPLYKPFTHTSCQFLVPNKQQNQPVPLQDVGRR